MQRWEQPPPYNQLRVTIHPYCFYGMAQVRTRERALWRMGVATVVVRISGTM